MIDETELVKNESDNDPKIWPKSKTFAGVTFFNELGGKIGEFAEYSYKKDLSGGKYILVFLDFNTERTPESLVDDEVLNTPSDVRLDFKIGKAGDRINPPVFAFRVSNRDEGRAQILFLTMPFEKRGLVYTLDAANGVVDSITLDESERPTEENHWGEDEVQNPTLFVEEYDEANKTFKCSITDPEVTKQLDQLGLPTTWINGRQKDDADLTSREIATYPELLKRFENLVISLINNNIDVEAFLLPSKTD